MKVKAQRFLMIGLLAFAVASLPVSAQQTSGLGLAAVLSSQGLAAMGQAVLTAAKAAFESSSDPDAIQAVLTSIMNEANATGNEQAIRYAIVAIMQAGGAEHLEITTAAINASQAASDFSDTTSRTVSEAQALLSAGGGTQQQGSGETGGGNEQQQAGGSSGDDEQAGGGGDDQQQGGGVGKLFVTEIDANNPFGGGGTGVPGDGGDGDSDFTPY